MISHSTNLPQNTIDAQVNSTSATASGVRITHEINDLVLPVYDTSKNCQTFLSSIPSDDKSYLQVLLVMCHPIDDEYQKRIQNLINIKALSKKAVRLSFRFDSPHTIQFQFQRLLLQLILQLLMQLASHLHLHP